MHLDHRESPELFIMWSQEAGLFEDTGLYEEKLGNTRHLDSRDLNRFMKKSNNTTDCYMVNSWFD